MCFFASVLVIYTSYSGKPDSSNTKTIENLSPYECGFQPFSAGSGVFDVHFYIVGVLFVLFDLELVFLYPWAVNTSLLGICGFFTILIFLLALPIGFIFEWNKGALDWTESLVLAQDLRIKHKTIKNEPRK
jgi:NADH:ubiquinone oxidoreductase subunit 3 (subunit A)